MLATSIDSDIALCVHTPTPHNWRERGREREREKLNLPIRQALFGEQNRTDIRRAFLSFSILQSSSTFSEFRAFRIPLQCEVVLAGCNLQTENLAALKEPRTLATLVRRLSIRACVHF